MKILKEKITASELKEMAQKMFENIVKAVVDIEREVVAIDGFLHVDLAELLVEQGSKNDNLWGINIYPEAIGTDNLIEFDSMINLKPQLGNRNRGIENEEIRNKITELINKLIK